MSAPHINANPGETLAGKVYRRNLFEKRRGVPPCTRDAGFHRRLPEQTDLRHMKAALKTAYAVTENERGLTETADIRFYGRCSNEL